MAGISEPNTEIVSGSVATPIAVVNLPSRPKCFLAACCCDQPREALSYKMQ